MITVPTPRAEVDYSGGHDPAAATTFGSPHCGAEAEAQTDAAAYICTRDAGHDGDHLAGTVSRHHYAARWTQS